MLEKDTEIRVGKLGVISFEGGNYIYVGSAPTEKRVARHLRKDKKLHWHIDYFLENANIEKIYIVEGEECEFVEKIKLPFIDGFGSSDCTCPSHLFFGDLEIKSGMKEYYP